jgi:hypothetical protein
MTSLKIYTKLFNKMILGIKEEQKPILDNDCLSIVKDYQYRMEHKERIERLNQEFKSRISIRESHNDTTVFTDDDKYTVYQYFEDNDTLVVSSVLDNGRKSIIYQILLMKKI